MHPSIILGISFPKTSLPLFAKELEAGIWWYRVDPLQQDIGTSAFIIIIIINFLSQFTLFHFISFLFYLFITLKWICNSIIMGFDSMVADLITIKTIGSSVACVHEWIELWSMLMHVYVETQCVWPKFGCRLTLENILNSLSNYTCLLYLWIRYFALLNRLQNGACAQNNIYLIKCSFSILEFFYTQFFDSFYIARRSRSTFSDCAIKYTF